MLNSYDPVRGREKCFPSRQVLYTTTCPRLPSRMDTHSYISSSIYHFSLWPWVFFGILRHLWHLECCTRPQIGQTVKPPNFWFRILPLELPWLGIHPNQEVIKFKPHGKSPGFLHRHNGELLMHVYGPLIDAVKQTHFCARKTNQTHGEFDEMSRENAAHFTWSQDHDVGHFGTYDVRKCWIPIFLRSL